MTSSLGETTIPKSRLPIIAPRSSFSKNVETLSLNNLIQCFTNLLDAKSMEKIQQFANSLNFQANPSFVFNRDTEENQIDPEVRKSKTVLTEDEGLISFLNDHVLVAMNEHVKGLYNFRLARNYVTFIRYDKGDFFEWHVDFEKVRVNHGENGFKEMHFLYCVQGCSEGGELLVKKPTETLSITEAKTTNSAVVFDKLMEHKGAEVIEGTKIIMTIDLYVVTEARVKTGLTLQVESEVSDLISKKRQWVSLRGNQEAFQNVWNNIYSSNAKKEFVPFLELKAAIGDRLFHIFATASGVCYIKLRGYEEEYEYRDNQWYYTSSKDNESKSPDSGVKKRFTLKSHKTKNSKWGDESEKTRYRNKLYKVFRDHLDDPVQMLEAAIRELTGSEIYEIDGLPQIEFQNSLGRLTGISKLTHMPDYFFEKEFSDWGWEKSAAGYNSYCNETDYSHFDIDYRYGIMHQSSPSTAALTRAKGRQEEFPWETEDEVEGEGEDEGEDEDDSDE